MKYPRSKTFFFGARREPRASALALLGSVAVHALVAAWLLTREAPPRSAPVEPPLEFTLLEPQAGSHEPQASEPASATVSDEPLRQPRAEHLARARRRTSAEPETSTGSVEVEAPQSPASEVPAAEPANAEPRPNRPLDLSPLAAALTLRDSLGAPGTCRAALADAAADCAAQGSAAAPAPKVLAGGPRLEPLGRPGEVALERQPDGSYAYEGSSFHATVAPDGRVTFEDKIVDLNSFVEHHLVGVQINTSEKRRFMQSTAALREQLADAVEAQNQKRARVALASKLESVLTSSLSLAQKRRALFDLWDDCASDASGNAAQASIEAFVRVRMPEGSPLAYSHAELSQLNRHRLSKRTFDPYAAADAGTRPG